MAYTWTSGEVITAEKLNQTGDKKGYSTEVSKDYLISNQSFNIIEETFDAVYQGDNPETILTLESNLTNCDTELFNTIYDNGLSGGQILKCLLDGKSAECRIYSAQNTGYNLAIDITCDEMRMIIRPAWSEGQQIDEFMPNSNNAITGFELGSHTIEVYVETTIVTSINFDFKKAVDMASNVFMFGLTSAGYDEHDDEYMSPDVEWSSIVDAFNNYKAIFLVTGYNYILPCTYFDVWMSGDAIHGNVKFGFIESNIDTSTETGILPSLHAIYYVFEEHEGFDSPVCISGGYSADFNIGS